MTTAIIEQTFQDSPVFFQDNAYLNATSIAKKFNKRPADYLKTEPTRNYMKSITNIIVIPLNQLVIVKKGSSTNGGGTWLHPKLAIDFARWLNSDFAVWCDMQIEKILHPAPIALKTLPAPRAKTYITGGLEKHQQDEINDMIALLVENVPQDKKAKTKIMIYSAINTKFGTKGMKHGYKNIAPEHFESITQLIARLPIEGELLPLQQKFLVTIEGGVSRSQPVPNDAYVLNTEQIKQNISEITPGHRLIPKNLYSLFMTLQEEIVKQQK